MPSHARYSAWDGTQVGFEFGAGDVFGELTDDLLYHGDLNAALRRMMQQGFEDRDGERVQGIREMLDQLRERRQEMLDQHDLGGVYNEVAERLREVIDTERAELDRRQQAAEASGDQRRSEVEGGSAAERQMQLDLLPPDLAGQVRELSDYDFASDEARAAFESLVEELREEMTQSYVNQMAGAMSDVTPEQMAAMTDMLADLNALLASYRAGEDTTEAFEEFMERHGEFFPENPRNTEELLEVMAQRMAAMEAMLNSMTPEQRQQLSELSDQLLSDLDLRWEMDQLSGNLQELFPQAGWDQSYNFEGQDPLGFAQAAQVMSELGDIDQLEQLLSGASQPGALAEVDLDRARQLLGDEAAGSLERMAELTRMLTEAGLVNQKEGRLELTPAGMRRLGDNALGELFRKLTKDRLGGHPVERPGVGHERDHTSKPYEYGDPLNLDIQRTLRNSLARNGPGTPLSLAPDDFEVERTDQLVRTSTVLMLDLSLSMPMRGNFLPAKKVAMALHALITSQYPRDFLGLVTFSEVAREIRAPELPEVAWDFVYGTNMQHGFALARRMLDRQSGTKQIIMITDGEPTAHITDSGEPFFHYPPVPETVDATLLEVKRCTRADIRINTFMLDATPYLQSFVEKLTELNRGRAFFTTPETLGDYVLVDFLEQRRARSRAARQAG